jgi:hypothetical protein
MNNGINVHKLKPGTLLLVATKNSLYKIAKCDKIDEVIIQGGKHIPEPCFGLFTGSTFGGSMIKLGWIGRGMFMEIFFPDQKAKIKTSFVKAVRIVGDGWEYDMWK